jgi:hypothetical protein
MIRVYVFYVSTAWKIRVLLFRFMEKHPVRGHDSFLAFEEMLAKAQEQQVIVVLSISLMIPSAFQPFLCLFPRV